MASNFELANLAIEMIERCTNSGMSYHEAMAFLIQTAEVAAEMEEVSTGICQENSFINSCNIALKEYRLQTSAEKIAEGKLIAKAPETLQ